MEGSFGTRPHYRNRTTGRAAWVAHVHLQMVKGRERGEQEFDVPQVQKSRSV